MGGEARRIWKKLEEGKCNQNILYKKIYFQVLKKAKEKYLKKKIILGRQRRFDENVHEARVNSRSWQDGGFVEGLRGSLCLLNRKKKAIAEITHLGREKQERWNPWFI